MLYNNSNYYLGAMTPNKTYQIANLPSSSILYVHSDETIRLKIADFSGTLIFSGSGTISIEGMWTKNCSMNNEAKMLINKGWEKTWKRKRTHKKKERKHL